MTKNKMSNAKDKNEKIKNIIKLLRFSLSIDDKEILKSSIEAIIELLEEEIV